MHGSVADSSMKFDSDVERVAEMLCLTIFIFNFFPECVARVPVSLWGSGG